MAALLAVTANAHFSRKDERPFVAADFVPFVPYVDDGAPAPAAAAAKEQPAPDLEARLIARLQAIGEHNRGEREREEGRP
jgi:hypothetical protein